MLTDDESGEKAVSVLLSGEESELIFIDHGYTEMTVSKWDLKVLQMSFKSRSILPRSIEPDRYFICDIS